MGTPFDAVEDIGLVEVDDYKLRKLYEVDPERFQKQLDAFLLAAIPEFYNCRKDLSYNIEDRSFNEDLSNLEIDILADLWVISWFTRSVQDSSQIASKMQLSGGFKNHSEAQNLKEKSVYLDKLKENLSLKLTNYSLMDLDSFNF